MKPLTWKTVCLSVAALFASTTSILAEPIFGVNSSNQLISFDSTSPETVINRSTITGLQTGELILGMDFRPANGSLYALGSTSRLYTINTSTGAATQVGSSAFTPVLSGTDFGFDFNPVPDRIRVVSDTNQNIRLHPDTGAVAGTDTDLAFATGDENDGATPDIVAAAYNNNFAGASTTTLFAIDSTLDDVVTIGTAFGATSPNTGQMTTLGALGVDTLSNAGFDISNLSGEGFLSLTRTGQTASELYSLDFGTGLGMTKFGAISAAEILEDIAVPLLDTTDPTVTVTSPASLSRTIRSSRTTITGTAADNLQVAVVKYRLLGSSLSRRFQTATGSTSWTFRVTNLRRGTNTVEIKAIDLHGNVSDITSVRIRRR